MRNASQQPAGLEDLVALNEEIASLVRAGVPLELGLKELGSGLSGRLGSITQRLADRMSGGASLSQALEQEGSAVPPAYRAVIEAGLQSGRLPEALESLTGFGRAVLEMRQRISLALLYPAIVSVVAYLMLLLFIWKMVPLLLQTRDAFRLPSQFWLNLLGKLHDTLPTWGPLVPLAVAAVVVVWTLFRSLQARENWWRYARTWEWMPGMRAVLRNLHRANFAEMLALLIEHRVPLPRAFPLAADATGARPMLIDAQQIAVSLEQGRSLADVLPRTHTFPPLMRWMMSAGERQGTLAAALRHTTDVYRRRAEYQAEWLKLTLPVLLTVIIGGGAVLIYALSLFLPLSQLLRSMGVGY